MYFDTVNLIIIRRIIMIIIRIRRIRIILKNIKKNIGDLYAPHLG